MCMPWNHEWITTNEGKAKIFEDNDRSGLPIKINYNVKQKCKKCGKVVIRRYNLA